MAEQNRPLTPEQAPDTARVYERAQPGKEAGMGRLDNNKATPTNRPDQTDQTVTNKQQPEHQINAQDVVNTSGGAVPTPGRPEQPDKSMLDEEPLGSDQAPQDINDPRFQRYPKRDGKGGTP